MKIFEILFCKAFDDHFILGIFFKKVFPFKKFKIAEFKTGRNHAAGKRISGSVLNSAENCAFGNKDLGLFPSFNIKTEFNSFKFSVFIDDMDHHRNSGMEIPDFIGFKAMETGNVSVFKKEIDACPKFSVSIKSAINGFCTAKFNLHPFIVTLSTQLIVYGIIFILVEKFGKASKIADRPVSTREALAIGFFQALAIIPGTAQPTVITKGITERPDNPTFLKIGSRTTATRAI